MCECADEACTRSQCVCQAVFQPEPWEGRCRLGHVPGSLKPGAIYGSSSHQVSRFPFYIKYEVNAQMKEEEPT